MLQAYHTTTGDLAERLMAALEAAEAAVATFAAASRRRCSSSGQPVPANHGRIAWSISASTTPRPLGELRRLLSVHRGYQHMEVAEQREIAGDMNGSLAAYEEARRLLAGNDEATFWAAILMADAGRLTRRDRCSRTSCRASPAGATCSCACPQPGCSPMEKPRSRRCWIVKRVQAGR